MGFISKAIKGVTNLIGEGVGAVTKSLTGGHWDASEDIRDLQRTLGLREQKGNTQQQQQQYDYSGLMSEYMNQMKEYMTAITETMKSITPAQEPLKEATVQMSNAVDETRKRQQLRSGLLSLTRFAQGGTRLGD